MQQSVASRVIMATQDLVLQYEHVNTMELGVETTSLAKVRLIHFATYHSSEFLLNKTTNLNSLFNFIAIKTFIKSFI